jgi:hypothetical protein
MIHLPIYSLPQSPFTPLLRRMIALSKRIGTLKAELNRKRCKLIMRGLYYESSWLVSFLEATGFQRVELRTFRVSSNEDLHGFIFAEKPANKVMDPTS